MTFEHEDILDCMARDTEGGQPFVIATVVRTEDATAGKPGDKALIRADGTVIGWVGGGCALGAVKKAAAAALKDGRPRLIRVMPKDMLEALLKEQTPAEGIELHASSCPSRGTTEVFIDPVLQRPTLLVVGTSPVAKMLCGLAKPMGYAVTVAGLAGDLDQFEDAEHRIEGFTIPGAGGAGDTPGAGGAGADTPAPAPTYDFVVVSSQGKRDKDALTFALSTGAGYVAFVGSRKKAKKLKADLIDAGLDPERVAALRSPAGLDIGSVTPDEIALSIFADIVRERRRGGGG